MMYFELIALVMIWAYCAIQLLLLYQHFWHTDKPYSIENQLPAVSILIPARNEAHQINNCLEAIYRLNYPLHLLYILVGDDGSTDHTAASAMEWKKLFPNFDCIQINQIHGKARAKANVIEHLMQVAQTEIVFVTDADIQVNKNWIKTLLPEFQTADMVSGITIVKGNTLFESMQGFEWLLGFSNLVSFEKLGLPSTAVGNNMAFSKTAYNAVGGYANIDFSVTEDLALTQAFRKNGFVIKTVTNHSSLNFSTGQSQFFTLLHQRKRWLIGAKQLPVIWKTIFMLQAFFLPALIFVALLHLKLALWVWFVKSVLQGIQILLFSKHIAFQNKWYLLPLFIVYQELVLLATALFYILPIPMNWKQRTYTKTNEPIY
jgi:1,2-diacylglycerol 3-beta-glucosyltransferase